MSFLSLYSERSTANSERVEFQFLVENLRRERGGLPRILSPRQKAKNALSYFYPPWRDKFVPLTTYDRCFAVGTREHAILRVLFHILIVEMVGIVSYATLGIKFSKDLKTAGTAISIIVHFILAGVLLYPALMTFMVLYTYKMLSNNLRKLMLLVMLIVAIEGPAMNTLANMQSMGEGLSCVAFQVKRSRENFLENAGALPGRYGYLLDRFRRYTAMASKPFIVVYRILEHVYEETYYRFWQWWKSAIGKWLKVSMSCKSIMLTPVRVCHTLFDFGYRKCVGAYRTLGIPSDSCPVFRSYEKKLCDDQFYAFAENVCNMPLEGLKKIKDTTILMAKKNWNRMKRTIYLQFGDLMNMVPEVPNLNLYEAKYLVDTSRISLFSKRIGRKVGKSISRYVKVLAVIVYLIRFMITPFIMIKASLDTIVLMYRYKYDEGYKNDYITDEFNKIDMDQTLRGNPRLLPLNEDESKTYRDRTSWSMSDVEMRSFFVSCAISAVAAVIPILFVTLDVLVFLTCAFVHWFLHATILEFPSFVRRQASGNGHVAKAFRHLASATSPVGGMSEDGVDFDQRWHECFAKPNVPNWTTLAGLGALFTGAIFLSRFAPWFSRQSLAVCDYFYPHRVRPRALFLYNNIVRDRHNLQSVLMKKQMTLVAEDQLVGRHDIVRRAMHSRGYVFVTCCKCTKKDLRLSDNANVRVCVECGAFYCIDCFSMNRNCVVEGCDADLQLLDEIDLYYEHVDDDDERDDVLFVSGAVTEHHPKPHSESSASVH